MLFQKCMVDNDSHLDTPTPDRWHLSLKLGQETFLRLGLESRVE